MTQIVREIQTMLKGKGFDPGPIDGELGPKTLAAMRSYLSTNVAQKTKEVIEKIANPVPEPEIDTKTLKGKDRPLYAKNLLVKLGWRDFQAAALVGQFMQESYEDLRTNVWGDNKTAYGIGQWRDNYDKNTGKHSPGRLSDLAKFATDTSSPMDDLKTQVLFANWELTKGSEVGVGKRLKASKNLDEALEAAIGYERPRGYSLANPRQGHGWSNREKYAKSLL